MIFEAAEVRKLARLARLSLSEEEVISMQHHLGEVTKYVDSLQKVNVDNVEPMTHAVPLDLPLRRDEAMPGVGRLGLAGSAGYENGLIKVPKIIE
jgi:aspartyl-tRNA(Asn)/glutamyl-tRNA(Gln) amidotransferase subunit C